ncbi:MAG: DUF3343 domain-containing protein [Clostridia bacterium]|nr:DUF3343 domain-containing protein [Clostridia bacterium]
MTDLPQDKGVLLLFSSVTGAQRCRQRLEEQGMESLLVKLDRHIAGTSCDYCLRISAADSYKALETVKTFPHRPRSVYSDEETPQKIKWK